jgi:hypothetical protein
MTYNVRRDGWIINETTPVDTKDIIQISISDRVGPDTVPGCLFAYGKLVGRLMGMLNEHERFIEGYQDGIRSSDKTLDKEGHYNLKIQCPDGQLPDGEICPTCGKKRGPSGIDGGTWVHIRGSNES